ncbi:MAG: sigma-70 family RNA polymerase sigma factor [Prevotella sp.]|nr:sigma-70 family RNA polymerase sigma factor [Prevotella sp.]
MTNDEEIIRRVLDEKTDEFRTIVDRHGTHVATFIRQMTGSRETAEDLTQETFLQAWRHLASFRTEKGSLERWLLRIAYTQTMMHLRKLRPTVSLESTLSSEGTDGYEEPDDSHLHTETLHEALERLTASDRALVYLYYIDGLKLKDISLAMGHNTAWLATRLQRIRQRLYKIMTQQ